MSISKRKTDESECEKYLTDNLRVEGPSKEFEEYDSEYFPGPRGAYGGVVFDNRGHAIKFSRARLLEGKEESFNTCVAARRGYAPEFYDSWKVKDKYNDIYYAIDMERFEITLLDYFFVTPIIPADDADVDASLCYIINKMTRDNVCHLDLHCQNIMLKRNIDGHYFIKAIDWALTEFNKERCSSTFKLYTEMESIFEAGDFKNRFPLTERKMLDVMRGRARAVQEPAKKNRVD